MMFQFFSRNFQVYIDLFKEAVTHEHFKKSNTCDMYRSITTKTFQCVVPENIHTPTMEGISCKSPEFPFFEHKSDPLPSGISTSIYMYMPIPSGKNSFGKSQFYSKITYKWTEINMNKKFSTLWKCNIMSTLIKKLIFMKEIDCCSTALKTDAKTN